MISYYSENIKFKLKEKRRITSWLRTIAANNGYRIGALNYIFCSDSYLLEINKKYLGHDYLTDIITFDSTDDYKGIYPDGTLCGDIYISVDTIEYNGKEYGEGFDRELHRVIAHGLLHIIGYDDTDQIKQEEMTRQENLALDLYYNG